MVILYNRYGSMLYQSTRIMTPLVNFINWVVCVSISRSHQAKQIQIHYQDTVIGANNKDRTDTDERGTMAIGDVC